ARRCARGPSARSDATGPDPTPTLPTLRVERGMGGSRPSPRFAWRGGWEEAARPHASRGEGDGRKPTSPRFAWEGDGRKPTFPTLRVERGTDRPSPSPCGAWRGSG